MAVIPVSTTRVKKNDNNTYVPDNSSSTPTNSAQTSSSSSGGSSSSSSRSTSSSSNSGYYSPGVSGSGYNQSFANQTVYNEGTKKYDTYDADGRIVKSTTAGSQAALSVQDALRSGTTGAGDAVTQQIASGYRNANDGRTTNATYTMAAAQAASGQVPDTTGLSQYQIDQLKAAYPSAFGGQTSTLARTTAFDPNADYNALARQAAANGDWASVQNYLNLRQQKIDAQGGNDRGVTNAQILADLQQQYASGQPTQASTAFDPNADYNALARQAAANGDWVSASNYLNLRQQKIDAQGGNDRGTTNAQIWADLVQQYGGNQPTQATATQELNLPSYTPTYMDNADTSLFKNYLDQWMSAAQQQATNAVDYAVNRGVNDLERAREDALSQYQTQQNQIDLDERRAMDNQALRNRINQGAASGVGEAQIQQIQAAAMSNRQTVNTARTQMTTDVARQIADLRAQGEFEKADSLLQITQSYLSQLMQLEQWAMQYNMNVAQFNEQVSQWAANYNLQVRQAEISAGQWAQQFAYQLNRDAIADARYAQEYADSRADLAWNREYQTGRDAVSDSQWAQTFAANREDAAFDKEYKLQQADRAYDQWRQEFQAGRTDAEFSQWLQRQNLALNQNNQEFNQSVTLRQLANSEQNQQWSQAMQQAQLSGSYGMAMLNQGVVPDAATLQSMGISQTEAQAYAAAVNSEKQISNLSALAKAGLTTDGKEIPFISTSKSYNSSDGANNGVTSAASSQVGYKEDSKGNTVFTDWYSAKTGTNFTGQPWCAMYVQWAFDQAGLSELLPTVTASTSAFVKAAKAKKQWVTSDYQPGDVVCFDWQNDGVYDHMGIVVGTYTDSNGRKYIQTVEGNTSDQVSKKSRLATSSSVAGAFRPNYAQFGASGSNTFNLSGITNSGTSTTSASSANSMSDTNLTAAMRTITGFLDTGKISEAESSVNQIWNRLTDEQKSRVTSALSKYVNVSVG